MVKFDEQLNATTLQQFAGDCQKLKERIASLTDRNNRLSQRLERVIEQQETLLKKIKLKI
ncbi:hypothetical protein GCM10027299_44190 [Larkinella ripae]